MSALCEYALTEWRPRLRVRSRENTPDVLPVLMKALAPFREAREAVVQALRDESCLE